jgi:hypothetical protein
VIVYHRTDSAEDILREGFRDGTGTYMTANEYSGVWVSADEPLTINEGAVGAAVIAVDIPTELFEQYEWVEAHKPYREALIPATLLNQYPRYLDPGS